MLEEIKHIQSTADLLYDQNTVDHAIKRMAEQINSTLADSNPLVLCVINGGIVVAGQLLPYLNIPLNLDSINASRYQNQTSGGEIKWLLKPEAALKDRVILIIDDILDEGITLKAIRDYCLAEEARSVYSAVLLDKTLDHEKPITADFVGLKVENRYLFGYGMDYKGYLRNATGIYACKE